MDELPKLVTDLALILIVAGVVTIVFKRLKQPLVLGYIVAGFLSGPHMPYMPSVEDAESIEVWSQIGVVFLMFSLGLEFSFKKLVSMGIGPVITACCVMMCMIGVGCGVGYLMGWELITCMFLGGMLSMSSTTIIYKAFDDLELLNKKFAGRVLSVLILEDILGIIVMVILSALAVSNKFHGTDLLIRLGELGFFLLLWFLVGIWLVPTFLRRNKSFINRETLLIVSLGLCFLMVVIVNEAGYSSALGAFMMGSILAETIEAERIEGAIASVKDLFGAIFFVSVGMLVSPHILVDYWAAILFLVFAIVVGQMLFGTFSYLLSGSTLKDAMQSGFSMVQIGEFAFIIAGMGKAMGVTADYLYPVIVAVSIITTFITPYSIKSAMPLYNKIVRWFNIDIHSEHRNNKKSIDNNLTIGKAWKKLLGDIVIQVVAYGTLSLSVLTIFFVSMLLLCRQLFGHWPGNAVCGVITLLVLSLFIRPMVMKKNHSIEATYLSQKGVFHNILLIVQLLVRFYIAASIIYYVLDFLSPFRWYCHIVASVAILLIIIRTRAVKYYSVRMERTFVQNLHSREHMQMNSANRGPSYARVLRGRDLHIVRITLPFNSSWAGKTLAQLRIGNSAHVHVVAIIREKLRINIPGGGTMLFPGDVIELLGDDDSIENITKRVQAECVNTNETVGELKLKRMIVGAQSQLIGKFIKQSGIRDQYHCMVVGFENSDGILSIASADHVFSRGDTMWIVGAEDNILRIESLL